MIRFLQKAAWRQAECTTRCIGQFRESDLIDSQGKMGKTFALLHKNGKNKMAEFHKKLKGVMILTKNGGMGLYLFGHMRYNNRESTKDRILRFPPQIRSPFPVPHRSLRASLTGRKIRPAYHHI